jgi:hypothetical protein
MWDRPVEEGLVDDLGRIGGIPEDGDPVLGHAQVGEHVEEARAPVFGVLAGVVGHTEGGARSSARESKSRARRRQDRSDPPHALLVGRSASRS